MKFRLLLAATLLFTACTQTEPQSETSLKIVTTIAPLYSFTAHLTEGTNAEITNIVPPNTSVHEFQLTPESAKALHDADLIVINGIELEEFLEDILLELEDKIVYTGAGILLIKNPGEEHHEEEHTEGHAHGEFDPHVWLSTDKAKLQAENIFKALVQVDPDNDKLYIENFKKLSDDLDDFESDAESRLAALDITPYIVFHNAYQYFEKDYDLKPAAYLEEFPGQEPSAEYLAEIIETIQDHNVEVIFTEPQFSPKLVETLSQDYKLKTAELDSEGQSVSKDAYFEMMEANLTAFESVFTKK